MLFLENLQKAWEQAYCDCEGELWGKTPSPFLLPFLNKIILPSKCLIGDFGSGDGRNSLHLLEKGLSVLSVDIAKPALNRLSQKIKQNNLTASTWVPVHSALESLPFGNDFLDAGLCLDTLPQIQYPRRALEEIQRTLKPGAPLLINFFTPADCAFGEGEMLGPKSFLYKGCLFQFFEQEDCLRLFEGLFKIIKEDLCDWIDPPHFPFRQEEHNHQGLVYILEK